MRADVRVEGLRTNGLRSSCGACVRATGACSAVRHSDWRARKAITRPIDRQGSAAAPAVAAALSVHRRHRASGDGQLLFFKKKTYYQILNLVVRLNLVRA